MLRRAFFAVFGTAFLLAASCNGPTQVMLLVETDVPCKDANPKLEWTEISVGPETAILDGNAPVARVDSPACVNGRVGTLVVVPSGHGERFQVRVASHVKYDKPPTDSTPNCRGSTFGSDCMVARRVATFVRHSSLTLPIFLSSACLGKVCPNDQTCIRGECKSPDCDKMNGCMEKNDAGLPIEAGTIVDASKPDALSTVGCGMDTDCIKFASTCDGTKLMLCVCYAFSKKDVIPQCDGTPGSCLIDPCMDFTARCVMGKCVLQ